MNLGRTVVSQLIEHLPSKEFQKCVSRYRGDSYLKSFSCDQFLAMASPSLTYRASLRDIETCLRSMHGKLYHMGFRGRVARSTLADAKRVARLADLRGLRAGLDWHGTGRYMPTTRSVWTWTRLCTLSTRQQSTSACRCFRGRDSSKSREDAVCNGNIPTFTALLEAKLSSTRSARRPARSTSWIGPSISNASSCTLCSSFFVVRTKKNILLQRRYSHHVDKSRACARIRPSYWLPSNRPKPIPTRCGGSVTSTPGRTSGWTNNFAQLTTHIYKSRWQLSCSSGCNICESTRFTAPAATPSRRRSGSLSRFTAIVRKRLGRVFTRFYRFSALRNSKKCPFYRHSSHPTPQTNPCGPLRPNTINVTMPVARQPTAAFNCRRLAPQSRNPIAELIEREMSWRCVVGNRACFVP